VSEFIDSDDVTAAAVSHPDPEASDWRSWLAQHGRKLLLFARQQTRTEQDAEDVFQDALVRLLGKIREGEFVGGQESWLPYLYASIRRLAIDLGRRDDRRRRREDAVGEDQCDEARGPDQNWFEGDASDEETRGLLERGLKELPEKFSEVIVLKVWGDKTFAEIGEILGISQNTAASRYRYGLEGLRRNLGRARIKGDL
jgi:RNA polymerase sigma-70 factor (ECF subfamily)